MAEREFRLHTAAGGECRVIVFLLVFVSGHYSFLLFGEHGLGRHNVLRAVDFEGKGEQRAIGRCRGHGAFGNGVVYMVAPEVECARWRIILYLFVSALYRARCGILRCVHGSESIDVCAGGEPVVVEFLCQVKAAFAGHKHVDGLSCPFVGRDDAAVLCDDASHSACSSGCDRCLRRRDRKLYFRAFDILRVRCGCVVGRACCEQCRGRGKKKKTVFHSLCF